MKNGQNLSVTLALAAIALLASSCEISSADVFPFGRKSSQSIKVNVSSPSNYSETKSDSDFVLMHTFGDDDFSISEYVSDISNIMDLQETKGSIITTTGINSNGQSFTVDGWGMISPGKGKPQELTNHLVKLTASYTASGTDHWPWADGANPKWVNEANLHIWSYYPVGKINPEITIDDATDANNTAVFSNYTTDNTDLLIAYNKEYREFKKDAAGNHTYDPVTGEITNDIIGEPTIDIKFYHALAAIEFELDAETGADVHSITLCKVDTDNNIITDDGIAMTGDCTVSGSKLGAPVVGTLGTGTAGVSWSNLGGKKPFHYEFGTNQSVAGGYTSASGNGVFFMIPQDVEDIVVIVEFSKYGSSNYYTKVGKLKSSNETSIDVSWQAGKYYKYNLSIGEFHVPGENLKLTDVDIAGLKNTAVIKRPLSAINIKGVSKIGLVLNNYQLGAEPGQVVYMHAIINGLDQVSYNGDPKAPTTTVSNFDFDFDPVDDTALDASGMIYEFGDETEEEYHNYYCFDQRSGSKKSKLTEYNSGVSGPLYYVFNTPGDGNKTFQIGFQPSAGSNDGGYAAGVRCLIVLEVAKDPYLPGNFPLTSWP